MDKRKIINNLRSLYELKEVHEGFPSQQACIEWSNRVAPLLKFNKQYYINFIENAHKLNLPLSHFTLEPAFRIMVSQVQMAIEELKITTKERRITRRRSGKSGMYINKSRIKELKQISKSKYDLIKLNRILEEMNICCQNRCYFSIASLNRIIIDHVPPIFGCVSFSEVANNYKGSKSFKESMQHLNESCRKIADQQLHCKIREREVLPNNTQVDIKNDLDVLLAEIVRILK